MTETPPKVSDSSEDPPPFGRTWTRLYAAVLIELVLLIVLFYVFTKAYE